MTYVQNSAIISNKLKGTVMISIKKIYYFYFSGFKRMTLGKTLWKVVFIKLAVIFLLLNYFIHDKSFTTEYKTENEKINFVYENLIGEK